MSLHQYRSTSQSQALKDNDVVVSEDNEGGRRKGVSAPNSKVTAAILGSSVDTRSRSHTLLFNAATIVQPMRSFPASGRMFFRRMPFYPPRAGMMPRILCITIIAV